MKKAYIFVYSDSTGGREIIKAWANQEESISHWRYDMPHCFYIISKLNASELAASFTKFNGSKGRFLITEIGENRQGLLPSETWYLFRNKIRKPKE